MRILKTVKGDITKITDVHAMNTTLEFWRILQLS